MDDISIEDLNQLLSKFWIPDRKQSVYRYGINMYRCPTEDELRKFIKLMRKMAKRPYKLQRMRYGTCENMRSRSTMDSTG
jgi:hypothetical protein